MKKTSIIIILCIAVLAVFLIKNKDEESDRLTIILSPHFDDASLSLGGLLSQEGKNALIVNFFVGGPTNATTTDWDIRSGFASSTNAEVYRIKESENSAKITGAQTENLFYQDYQYGRQLSDEELVSEISKDIQLLIASKSNIKEINVYGPAIFSHDISHPDHAALHQAFMNVARDYPGTTTHFYIYEDMPYILRFNREQPKSLQAFLEQTDDIYIERKNISLTHKNIEDKLRAIKAHTSQVKAFESLKQDIIEDVRTYTETRCGKNPNVACEVVYGLKRFTE